MQHVLHTLNFARNIPSWCGGLDRAVVVWSSHCSPHPTPPHPTPPLTVNSRYHLKDVIVGKIYFLLVRIKIRHMEIDIIKRETTGTGPNVYQENDTIAKYEIMDGAPVRGTAFCSWLVCVVRKAEPCGKKKIIIIIIICDCGYFDSD